MTLTITVDTSKTKADERYLLFKDTKSPTKKDGANTPSKKLFVYYSESESTTSTSMSLTTTSSSFFGLTLAST